MTWINKAVSDSIDSYTGRWTPVYVVRAYDMNGKKLTEEKKISFPIDATAEQLTDWADLNFITQPVNKEAWAEITAGLLNGEYIACKASLNEGGIICFGSDYSEVKKKLETAEFKEESYGLAIGGSHAEVTEEEQLDAVLAATQTKTRVPKCPDCGVPMEDVGNYTWDCPNNCLPMAMELSQIENEDVERMNRMWNTHRSRSSQTVEYKEWDKVEVVSDDVQGVPFGTMGDITWVGDTDLVVNFPHPIGDVRLGKNQVHKFSLGSDASMKEADDHNVGDVLETCECNGDARLVRYENGIAILKCDDCGDTFDAHEKFWRKAADPVDQQAPVSAPTAPTSSPAPVVVEDMVRRKATLKKSLEDLNENIAQLRASVEKDLLPLSVQVKAEEPLLSDALRKLDGMQMVVDGWRAYIKKGRAGSESRNAGPILDKVTEVAKEENERIYKLIQQLEGMSQYKKVTKPGPDTLELERETTSSLNIEADVTQSMKEMWGRFSDWMKRTFLPQLDEVSSGMEEMQDYLEVIQTPAPAMASLKTAGNETAYKEILTNIIIDWEAYKTDNDVLLFSERMEANIEDAKYALGKA